MLTTTVRAEAFTAETIYKLAKMARPGTISTNWNMRTRIGCNNECRLRLRYLISLVE
jgi:hypothetical protein